MNLKALSQFVLLSSSLAMVVAYANPQGGEVINGNIVIHPTDSTGTMVIDQFSDKGIVNWDSFNIAKNETTVINQPGSSSTHMSRVIGEDPSQILGKLSSNGKVFLINPNGVVFGEGARVDAPALVTSTLNIKDQDFKNENYDFNAALNPQGKAGSIINEGILNAPSGLIALIAPQIKNKGIINAELGQIELGAGSHAVLKMGNNPLLDFELDQPLVVINEQGRPVVIDNSGTIKADGGQVYLSAAGAHQVLHQVVSNSGVIEANSVAEKNGQIILYAQSADTEVSGSLKADGGKIGVYGKHINISDSAKINVSGSQAGIINIGGPAGGKGNLPKADETIIAQGASLQADSSGANKDGGQIVVWANEYTKALGDFSAQSISGHGGLVETSSAHSFDVMGANVNTSSQHKGWSGTWLLDPSDVTIDATLAAQIVAALATTNVLVTTAAGTGSGVGDLTVASNITYSGGSENNNLTLRAEHDINVNAVINGSTNGNISLQAVNDINMNTGGAIASSGTGTVSLRADYNGTGTGTVVFGGVGAQISKSGFGSRVEIFYNPAGGYTGAEESTVTADYFSSRVVTAVGASLDSYMLINSTSDLTAATLAVNTDQYSGNYDPKFAFGKALDLTGYSFTQIGNFTMGAEYAGHFNGQSYVISNLTFNNAATTAVGFFGIFTGVVRNLALTNVNITANSAVGAIAGASSQGSIINSYATGIINAVATVGGLVGNMINGSVSNSYADVDVTTGNYLGVNPIRAGGLVGDMGGGSTISNSYAAGNVTVGGDSGGPSSNVLAGGLIGYITDTGASNTVTSSYATGTVTGGENSYIGGFIGWLTSAAAENTISNSYSTGAVNSTSSEFAGGFAGAVTGDTTITNSYTVSLVNGTGIVNRGGFAGVVGTIDDNNDGLFWNTTIYGGSAPNAVGTGSSTGITDSTTSAMQTPSTFTGAGWSTSIWDLESGSYPTLIDAGLSATNTNPTTTLPDNTPPSPSAPTEGQTANSVNTSVVDTAVTENLSTSIINAINPAEPEAILTMDCDRHHCASRSSDNNKANKA